MAQLISGLDAARVGRNLRAVQEQVARAAARAGRAPSEVEILAATKYLPPDELPALAAAGVRLVGENRAQDLEAKVAAHGPLFEWDFIGALQSRKVRRLLPLCRVIHSLASDSALRELERHRELARPGLELLVEVNVAGEAGKAGIAPSQLGAILEACPLPVTGLMTMPPASDRPEHSRPWFAALARLAREHDLRRLSMGTSQDFAVAVEEGATIIRLGGALYR